MLKNTLFLEFVSFSMYFLMSDPDLAIKRPGFNSSQNRFKYKERETEINLDEDEDKL